MVIKYIKPTSYSNELKEFILQQKSLDIERNKPGLIALIVCELDFLEMLTSADSELHGTTTQSGVNNAIKHGNGHSFYFLGVPVWTTFALSQGKMLYVLEEELNNCSLLLTHEDPVVRNCMTALLSEREAHASA